MTTMVIDHAHARRIGDLLMALDRQPAADVVPQAAIVRGGPSLRAA
jgi:hypothetical protein